MIIYHIKNGKYQIIDLLKKKSYETETLTEDRLLITYDLTGGHKAYKLTDGKSLKYHCLKHNTNEIETTFKLFIEKQDLLKCKLRLIKEFNLPQYMLNSSLSKISEFIIEPVKGKDTKIIFDDIELKKYNYMKDFYKKQALNEAVVNIAGVEHKFGRGGVHGQIKKYHKKGDIIYIDIQAFYTTILHKYKVGFNNFKNINNLINIHNKNIILKGSERIPYKLIDNSIVGNFKNKYSLFYNPTAFENIVYNGQLILISLIEKIEPYVELIQTNTDGLIVECLDFDKLDYVVYEWEKKTGFKVNFEYYDEIFQKDVNNYILLGEKNKFVGDIAKDNIINEAIKNYLINKITIEETILGCNDKEKFKFVIDGLHFKLNNVIHTEAIKIFAYNGGHTLYWQKQGRYEKVPNTPKFCDLEKISKDWYIKECYRRIKKWC